MSEGGASVLLSVGGLDSVLQLQPSLDSLVLYLPPSVFMRFFSLSVLGFPCWCSSCGGIYQLIYHLSIYLLRGSQAAWPDCCVGLRPG